MILSKWAKNVNNKVTEAEIRMSSKPVHSLVTDMRQSRWERKKFSDMAILLLDWNLGQGWSWDSR